GHRREIAAGADGAELGDAGQDVVVEQADERVEGLEADTAPAGGELGEPGDHDRAGLVVGEPRADAAAMEAEQVGGEAGAVLDQDGVDDRGAEAGVDAVERLAAARPGIDDGAALAHAVAPAGELAERDAELAARDPGDVVVGDARLAEEETG